MTDLDPTTVSASDAPERLFAALGFGFVQRFLWLVLATCLALAGTALALGWHFEGDVTVRGAGQVRSARRHVVKSGLDGVVAQVKVRDGDRVEKQAILLVLSPGELRARLAQVEQDLALSAARQASLAQQIEAEQQVLTCLVHSRRLDVERAALVIEQARQRQRHYGQPARAGWRRRQLEQLLPVRLAAADSAQAEAQLTLAERQLEVSRGRREELRTEREYWARLDAQRLHLWQALEHAVVRAPSAGVVLTRGLDQRLGDRVEVGTALLELAVEDAWTAQVLVSQLDRPRLKPGQRARIFVEAFPHLEYGALEGQVASVGEQPAPGGLAYPVDIAIDRRQGRSLALADGMVAEAKVAVDRGRLLDLLWRRVLRHLGEWTPPELKEARG